MLAAFQFGDQALVERQEFAQPPRLAGDEVAVLQVEAFQEQVADLREASVFSQDVERFKRQRVPVRNDLGLNESLTDLPGTQPRTGPPQPFGLGTWANAGTQVWRIARLTGASGKALWIWCR